ncbi:MAG: SDR family oxidoreductase [Atopostipes suicloacalis]|nr:SDR family oxidoreductase [Atopostipes suicloacalis]MDN6731497.1 SDR family oxidoreductase [Atopostipes suicloacalis]
MRLENKVTIITGGAGGIGRGMAMAYVKEGAKVVIVDLNEDAGNKVVKELQKYQPESMFIKQDLTEKNQLKPLVEKVADKYGRIDILINNAHASRMASIENTTQEDIDFSFNTGFYPTFYLMQAALPYLKESKGKIINFASGAGIEGHANQGPYAAAKEAIRGISRVAANEFGEFGINVNIISPIAKSEGIMEWAENNPKIYEGMLAGIPLGRIGELEEDIGRVAVFLGSEDSDYITGQTLMVDGGSIKLR